MNDTKTLCDVVGKALDEYGNGKAQDAFAELLTRLRSVEKERDEDQGVIRVWRGRCERAEKEREETLRMWREYKAAKDADALRMEERAREEFEARERAEADNAALLRRIDAIGHSLGTYGNDVTTQELIGSILRESHPGAALLAELEGLHEENARLKEERNHWERRAGLTVAEVVRESYREPIAIRVEGIHEPMRAIIEQTARDAAFEEAAQVVQKFSAEWQRVADGFRTDEYSAKWSLAAEIAEDVENEIRALKGMK